MCLFITIGVEPHAVASLQVAARALELELVVSRNGSVARLFRPKDARFLVLRGGCSCGLLVPIHRPSAGRRAWRKWSEAKRQRAFAAARRSGKPRGVSRALSEALALLARRYGSLRVFAQDFSSDPDKEAVDGVIGPVTMPAEDFVAEGLPKGTLVEIVP